MMHSHITEFSCSGNTDDYVLILVVMDDALALGQEQTLQSDWQVLILVVMDDALAPQNLGYALFKRTVRLVCAS